MDLKPCSKEVLQINFSNLQKEYSKAEAKISAMNDAAKNSLELLRKNKKTMIDIVANWEENEELVSEQLDSFRAQLSVLCKSIFAIDSLESPKRFDLKESKTLRSSEFKNDAEFISEIFRKVSNGEKLVAVHQSNVGLKRCAEISVWRKRLLVHTLQIQTVEELSGKVCVEYVDLMKIVKTLRPAGFIKVNMKGNFCHHIHFDLMETYFKPCIIDLCTGENCKTFKGTFVNDCSSQNNKQEVKYYSAKYLFQFEMDCELQQLYNYWSNNDVSYVSRFTDETFLTNVGDSFAFVKAKYNVNLSGLSIGKVISDSEEIEMRSDALATIQLHERFGLITDCGLSVQMQLD